MSRITFECDSDELAEQVAEQLDAADVAQHLDASDLASYVDHNEIAGALDLDDIAGHVSVWDLSREIDLSDLANEIDMGELARHCNDSEIESRVDGLAIDAQSLRDRVCAIEDDGAPTLAAHRELEARVSALENAPNIDDLQAQVERLEACLVNVVARLRHSGKQARDVAEYLAEAKFPTHSDFA